MWQPVVAEVLPQWATGSAGLASLTAKERGAIQTAAPDGVLLVHLQHAASGAFLGMETPAAPAPAAAASGTHTTPPPVPVPVPVLVRSPEKALLFMRVVSLGAVWAANTAASSALAATDLGDATPETLLGVLAPTASSDSWTIFALGTATATHGVPTVVLPSAGLAHGDASSASAWASPWPLTFVTSGAGTAVAETDLLRLVPVPHVSQPCSVTGASTVPPAAVSAAEREQRTVFIVAGAIVGLLLLAAAAAVGLELVHHFTRKVRRHPSSVTNRLRSTASAIRHTKQ